MAAQKDPLLRSAYAYDDSISTSTAVTTTTAEASSTTSVIQDYLKKYCNLSLCNNFVSENIEKKGVKQREIYYEYKKIPGFGKVEKTHKHYKDSSLEEKERKIKKRGHQRKLNLEEKERWKKREYERKLSAEKKEEMLREWLEYERKLRLKNKKEMNQKERERRRKLSPVEKEEMNQKKHKYERRLCPENKEEMKQKKHEYQNKISPEEKEEMRQEWLEYGRQMAAEKKRKKMEICECKKTENNTEVNTKNSGIRIWTTKEQILKTSTGFEKYAIIINGFGEDMKPRLFCYTCRMLFVNNSALLQHLAVHITLPSVVLPRIDANRVRCSIKKESKDTQIDSNLKSDITQNVICVKNECIEYNEDIKQDFDYTSIHTKTETEIEIDDVSFYTHVKKEIKEDCTNFL